MRKWWFIGVVAILLAMVGFVIRQASAVQLITKPSPLVALHRGLSVVGDPWLEFTHVTLSGPTGHQSVSLNAQGQVLASLKPGTSYQVTARIGWGWLSYSIRRHFRTIPKLAVSGQPKAVINRGILVTFNQPVSAVRWTSGPDPRWVKVAGQSSAVWLSEALPQGQSVTATIVSAQGLFGTTLTRPVTIRIRTPAPLYVLTNPGTWQFSVPPSGPFQLTFNQPVQNRASVSQDLTFNPPISGRLTWKNAETAVFTPATPLPPTTEETLILKGGPHGPLGPSGQYLPVSQVVRPFVTSGNELIVVRESSPETLTLYKNGVAIFQTLCNTGIPGAVTPTGSFYVRSKALFANMRGREPNGAPYYSPHVPWVMGLFGNVAIHGYVRARYGFPQSVGCIELPVANAQKLYGMVSVGTPVHILP